MGGGSPKDRSRTAAADPEAEQELEPAEHSSGMEEASRSGAASDSQQSSSSESSGHGGSEVVVQSGERVDLPAFPAKLEKPMMEMVAGSNVWYQAHVLRATAAKLRVLFPAPTEGRQPKKEWVLRTSSRIWRGSMAGRDWKYLSQGAWAPKTSKSARRNRKAAARKAGGGGGSGGGKRSGGLTGAATTGSGTGGAARSEAAPGARHDHTGEEPDVASPRKRLKHSPVSSGDGSPRYGGGADPLLQDAMGHRERGGGRARRPKAAHDPLAVWFEHHFALLDKASMLDSNLAGSPEAGFLQLDWPAGGGNAGSGNAGGGTTARATNGGVHVQ